MKGVFFGLGLQYDSGTSPSIAINRNGRVLEVHKNELGLTLYYRTGTTNQMNVRWDAAAKEYTGGVDPSVALNTSNRVVEVHKNEAGFTLYSRIGTLNGDTIGWNGDGWVDYTSGLSPSVALNDAGKVVEVHRSEKTTRLYWRVGELGSTNVDWLNDDNYDTGDTPQVAINNNDQVVEVHRSELGATNLWYHVGKITSENKIDFDDRAGTFFANGSDPSVALTDAGDVIVSWKEGTEVMQRFGSLDAANYSISWIGDAQPFDSGSGPSVAAAGRMAINAHEGVAVQTLWYSTSLITDRAIWMTEHRDQLGPRTIPQLTLPASHDSAMYLGDIISSLGKTQSLSIYDQLEYGIRYFDLRPEWTNGKFVIHHGVINGPDLSTVLDDIRSYCLHNHKELIVIDWSHFKNFDSAVYTEFTNQLNAKIGTWQYKVALQPGQRLAHIPLSQFTQNGPCILSAIDENWAIDQPKAGFWVFRNSAAADSDKGDLVVFDQYSETADYDFMRDNQLGKFTNYDGTQENFPNLPCDMFLLSWTLTSPVGAGVWPLSTAANRHLGHVIDDTVIPNDHGRIMNALYVDYVEFARVTDVGIIRNEMQSATVTAGTADAKLTIRERADPSAGPGTVTPPPVQQPPKEIAGG